MSRPQPSPAAIAIDDARSMLKELGLADSVGNIKLVLVYFQSMIDIGINMGVDSAIKGVDRAFDDFAGRHKQ